MIVGAAQRARMVAFPQEETIMAIRNFNEETLTAEVLRRIEGTPSPRLKQVMTSMVKHLHAFVREVRPILKHNCYECHGEKKQKSGLRLDVKSSALKGGDEHAPDIIAVAHATGRPPLEVARGFFVLGERLDIDWIETQLEQLQATTRWQRWAQQSMEDDLFAVRRRLCERMLESAGGAPIDEAVDRYFTERAQSTERVARFLRGLKAEGISDLSQLTVALRQLRSLAG